MRKLTLDELTVVSGGLVDSSQEGGTGTDDSGTNPVTFPPEVWREPMPPYDPWAPYPPDYNSPGGLWDTNS